MPPRGCPLPSVVGSAAVPPCSRKRENTMLHISRMAANAAGIRAVFLGRADSFTLQMKRFRNPDKSYEQGWRVVLRKRGRVVGFA